MAKNKVGVLEASESPDSSVPQTFCGRAIAELLIEKQKVRKLGKRLVQAFEGSAQDLIEWAKAERERAIKLWERQQLRLGIGNIVPFSRPTDAGKHYHYEIPHAGDIGVWRHFRKKIQVSARPQSHLAAQLLRRTQLKAAVVSLADAFSA